MGAVTTCRRTETCREMAAEREDGGRGRGLYLQWDSEADLLSVVTEHAPRSAEEDKTDPFLCLEDLLLQRRRKELSVLHLLSTS